ncbi:MAG TPA: protein kinase [Terriglobia bacterium]|nr:protein kinase [Terriglobia bacterium]
MRGKYRILDKLGEGGMAAVYKALHIRFDEFRALKVISTDLSNDPSFIKRLQQEAVVTRRLQHPNAVRVEDIDEAEDGRPFIVMEYIEGRCLKDVIEEAPLPVDRTCRIVKQVASALDAAHSLGILHRDIKPANIVLVDTLQGEEAKVLDFGIAKVKEANLGETAEMTLTGKGRVVGTAAYMSPEQAIGMRGDELDGRSDLYSLGVVMYQMLVGELPLKAESEVTMLMAHIQRPPDPILPLRPDLPKFIADLVMSLLEKKRDLRPANGRALIEQIERWERGEVGAAPVAQSVAPSPDQTILYREAFSEGAPRAAEAVGEKESTRKLSGFPGMPASPAGPWGLPAEAAPPTASPSAAERYSEVEATMLASSLGVSETETRLRESAVPLVPTSSLPESYPEDEATMLAAGLGGSAAETGPPRPIPPVQPNSAAEFGGGASEPYSDAGATMLASGFGAGEPSRETSPGSSATPPGGVSEGFSGGGTTMFASGFDTANQHEPAPSYGSVEGASNPADSYPAGEATMLAQSLMGEPLRHERAPARGFEAAPEGGFEGAPDHELASPAASGFGPESGFPGSDATRLASGGALPWESVAPPVEPPQVPSATGAGWTEAAPTPATPIHEDQPPQPVEPLPPVPRKAGWAVWAAVPLVAIVLGVGAWYFLTHTGGSQTGAPPVTSSPPAETPTAPSANSGAVQQPATQPASGTAAPAGGAPADNAAAGAGAKPEESKPVEKKPVDTRAVQALKAEGDLDYDKGQYDDAIRAYRKGLALDPGNRVLTQEINRARKAKQTEEKLLR